MESTCGVSRNGSGIHRSNASAYTDASMQMTAAAGHSASGSCWRTNPPAAGPISQPSCQEKLDSAM